MDTPSSPIASGIKCMKASPKSAPAENATKNRSTDFSFSFLSISVIDPTKDIELTIITLPIV